MLPQQTKRRRCLVLTDGTAIGCYMRNIHETHIVVLEPSSHMYTYIRPDGTRTRHLTLTALSSHQPLVSDILTLRNRVTLQSPYVHQRLMHKKDMRYHRRIRVLRARWPTNKGKVKVSRWYNSKEKCFEMQSIEGAAKVQLHPSGKLVEVYYIIEVKVSDPSVEVEAEASRYAHYTTMHQSFTIVQIPESFDFPVNILLKAKAAWEKDQEAEMEYAREDKDMELNKRVSMLPGNGAFTARPTFSVIATSSDGVHMTGNEENCLMLAEILRVATLPSKMLYHRVVAEMVGEDATLFVSRRPRNCLPEIMVQVDGELSLLTECDGFFTWYDEAGRPQHRFTRETIPPATIIDTKHAILFCQHIDYVLQAFKYASHTFNQDVLPLSLSQPNELELIEEVNNEHGRFRAFRGGRVRVVFADRTILQVERDSECCSFFFSDGSMQQTTLASAPLRHRTYIYQALEFGDWAFSSQKERMERHMKRNEAQAIVARELQRISVRCGMNSDFPVFHNCSKEAIQKKTETHLMGSNVPSLALSLAAVRELQAATLQHIVSVDHVLQAITSVTISDDA
ncbi:unnamed protein product [Peronospora effusa]|uniref:C5orf34-like C-terminal domain-containing protein n=1 Tax=Peronospora effusa TaxID=542832 RepID=A0A3R7XAX2_9STRA|nr:hypothetical protein DD237_006629 [Peronospora effusa]CAI5703701.1 unnamed protein product [Peronospora effusa]